MPHILGLLSDRNAETPTLGPDASLDEWDLEAAIERLYANESGEPFSLLQLQKLRETEEDLRRGGPRATRSGCWRCWVSADTGC